MTLGRMLSRAKPPTVQPLAAPFTAAPWPFGGDTTVETLLPLTEEQALDLAVVSGFLSILTSLISQMPLAAFAGTEQVTPTPLVLRNPVPTGNRVLVDWETELLRDLVLWGNFVAVLGDPDWSGWPAVMFPVPWSQWSLRPDGYYQVGSDIYRPDEIFHVRTRCRTGELVGRGLMQTHPRLLASAIAAEQWASTYYDGGAVPPVSVTHSNPELSQENAELLKAKFRSATRRREAVIVPSGTTITPLNSDADGAQLSESRKWGAAQLCIALGIPGALMGIDSPSLTYRNITDVFQQFLNTTVMSFLIPLESQLTAQCLPRNQTARFSTSAIVRPDMAARVAIAVQGLAGGVYSVDEARSVLDLPPSTDSAFDTDNPVVGTDSQSAPPVEVSP